AGLFQAPTGGVRAIGAIRVPVEVADRVGRAVLDRAIRPCCRDQESARVMLEPGRAGGRVNERGELLGRAPAVPDRARGGPVGSAPLSARPPPRLPIPAAQAPAGRSSPPFFPERIPRKSHPPGGARWCPRRERVGVEVPPERAGAEGDTDEIAVPV